MSRSAFTLIELLIVAAILLTLGALVYVLLGPMREQAREARCISNLHQIGQAITMYRADYEGVSRGGNKPRNALQRLGVPHSALALISAGYFKWAERSVFTCECDWRQVPGDTGLIVSYLWPAAGPDTAIPGTHIRERASEYRVREKGESVAVAIDPWHRDPYFLHPDPPPGAYDKAPLKRWLVLRLDGSVHRLHAYIPLGGSTSDL